MAVGKSTVAQLLAEECDWSAHIRGDAFRRMIVSGRLYGTSAVIGAASAQLPYN